MITTLDARRDRTGHTVRRRVAIAWLTAVLLVGLAQGALAASQEYAARRYDVRLEVLPGGDVRVSEVVTFDFQSGTFRHVWRTIPADRTDGIRILQATMDGVPMPEGTGPGHITISGNNRTRVEWQFEPVSPSTHTFALTYLARGVGVSADDADLIAWQALPTEHAYTIVESRITADAPSAPIDAEIVESRGIDRSSVNVKEDTVEATVNGVRRNGRLTIALRFPRGAIVTAQPEWRQRRDAIARLAPRWILAAGGIFLAGLLIVFSVRRQHESPVVSAMESTVVAPPERLAPALSTALLANGHASGAGAIATLLDLADRGVLQIRELSKRFGIRSYQISQVPGTHTLSSHEEAAIAIAFGGGGDDVTLSKAQARLARAGRRFASAVQADMAAEGLLDESRHLVARRLKVAGFTILLVGVASTIPAAALINVYGGWPLLVPLALVAAGLTGIIAGATTNVLSDEGALRAARWRGFKGYLKLLATEDQAQDASTVPPRFVVYAVALGLARPWSRYLKRHPAIVPAWFAAATQNSGDAGASFAALVSAGAHGGGAASGGGAAAGGGGSGAG